MTQNSQPTLADLIDLRLNRRGLIRGAAALAAASPFAAAAQEAGPSSLTFKELAHTLNEQHHVAEGYDMPGADPLGRPGPGRRAGLRPANQTAEAQARQFGYNNDYLGFFPLPHGSKAQRPRPAGRQPRIHQHQPDVPRPRRRPRGRQPRQRRAGRGEMAPRMAAVRGRDPRARAAAGLVSRDSRCNRRITRRHADADQRPGRRP